MLTSFLLHMSIYPIIFRAMAMALAHNFQIIRKEL